jgi:hypothetical protein
LVAWIEEHFKQLLMTALGLLVGFWLLRSCIPALDPQHLPAAVNDSIQKNYIHCLDYFPIFPGERRQPDCGRADVRVVGLGTIPEAQKAEGVTRAICYKVTFTNPSLTTQGGALGHEVLWNSRSASKVAILKNGEWETFPDLDQADEQRWTDYACPEAFEVK